MNTITERRHSIFCPNCKTPMVCRNKYITSKDNSKAYIWYVCPRRKANDEKGCGHLSLIKIKQDGSFDIDKNKLIFEGTVKTYEKQTFVLDDNSESIHGWIHKHAKNLEGKKVRLILEKEEEIRSI